MTSQSETTVLLKELQEQKAKEILKEDDSLLVKAAALKPEIYDCKVEFPLSSELSQGTVICSNGMTQQVLRTTLDVDPMVRVMFGHGSGWGHCVRDDSIKFEGKAWRHNVLRVPEHYLKDFEVMPGDIIVVQKAHGLSPTFTMKIEEIRLTTEYDAVYIFCGVKLDNLRPMPHVVVKDGFFKAWLMGWKDVGNSGAQAFMTEITVQAKGDKLHYTWRDNHPGACGTWIMTNDERLGKSLLGVHVEANKETGHCVASRFKYQLGSTGVFQVLPSSSLLGCSPLGGGA
jgi:hypothetical protein